MPDPYSVPDSELSGTRYAPRKTTMPETDPRTIAARKFARGIGNAVPDAPTVPSAERCVALAKLLMEETMETIAALGVGVWNGRGDEWFEEGSEFDLLPERDLSAADLTEIADGCTDVSFVADQIMVECGMDPAPVRAIVDDNNLLKIATGRMDDAGKFRKHPDHPKPDIAGEIERQRAAAGEGE